MNNIESPTGIDLNPNPPPVVRLSKRAGMLVLLVLTIVVALIGYGVVTRSQRSLQVGQHFDESKRVTAATDAGRIVAAQIPTGAGAGTGSLRVPNETEELQAPEATGYPGRPSAAAGYGPATNAAYPPPPPPEPTPEEKRRALQYERELAAMTAPTAVPGNMSQSGRPGPTSQANDLPQLAALLRTLPGAVPANAAGTMPRMTFGNMTPTQAEEYAAQNMQERKEAFLEKARKVTAENYLNSTRTQPAGRYEIKAGWDIPAVLEQALNSDLPGELKALVRENVYDTVSGKYLLIPQGARLVGVYDSRVAYGQDGIMVVWNRIIFPDGSSLNLEGMGGQDAKGYTGLRHSVDNHYKRLLGFGLLTSAFSAAFQLSQSRRGGLLGYPSAGETAGSAVGREMSQLGADVTRRNLNVQPTVKVPIGYRFNVRVNRDILFDSPYPAVQPR